MLKINFHGDKNQFSSPVTTANFCAGYVCMGNTLIWLAGIRGKTCSTLIWLAGICGKTCSTAIWLVAFAVKLVPWPANKFYRECQPIKWECYLCTRSQHGSLRVSRGKKIDFYHRGNWFLPPWKLIFTTMQIFSSRRNFNFSITLTFYRPGK